MSRTEMAAAIACLLLTSATADAQSWIFQPGSYSQSDSEQASAPAYAPRAQASFTQSQSVAASRLPRPAFQWDPTGIVGRGQRFEMWSHQEAMEASRLRTYAQGVRDAVGGPVWTWSAPAPRPVPQIMAPTAKSPGKTRLPAVP